MVLEIIRDIGVRRLAVLTVVGLLLLVTTGPVIGTDVGGITNSPPERFESFQDGDANGTVQETIQQWRDQDLGWRTLSSKSKAAVKSDLNAMENERNGDGLSGREREMHIISANAHFEIWDTDGLDNTQAKRELIMRNNFKPNGDGWNGTDRVEVIIQQWRNQSLGWDNLEPKDKVRIRRDLREVDIVRKDGRTLNHGHEMTWGTTRTIRHSFDSKNLNTDGKHEARMNVVSNVFGVNNHVFNDPKI